MYAIVYGFKTYKIHHSKKVDQSEHPAKEPTLVKHTQITGMLLRHKKPLILSWQLRN